MTHKPHEVRGVYSVETILKMNVKVLRRRLAHEILTPNARAELILGIRAARKRIAAPERRAWLNSTMPKPRRGRPRLGEGYFYG